MASTNYITPIMNRTQADVEYARTHQNDLVNKNRGAWNYTDLNRICNNLKYAAEYMYDQGFLLEPYSMQVKTDWTETDIITYEQLNSMIINTMNDLKTYARPDLNWNPIISVTNVDYSIANLIEKNIHQLATQEPIPPDEFTLTIIGGTGGGDYVANTVVNIRANPPVEGQTFDYWSGDHLENIGSATSAVTTYKMPNQNITLTAHYSSIVAHTLTVNTYSGTSTSQLLMGAIKYIEADPAPQGKVFHHWNVSPNRYEENLYEPAATTHFTMPNEAVTLTAVYITKGQKQLVVRNGNGSGYYEYGTYAPISSSKPSNATFTSWSGDTQYLTGPITQEYNSVLIPDVNRITIQANWSIPPTPPTPLVENVSLTVVDGVITSTGQTTGTFTEKDNVTITADPVPDGYRFSGWTKTGGGSISSIGSTTTVVTIGNTAATVTATRRQLEYHNLTVITNSGTTQSQVERLYIFTVDANPPPNGYVFDRWTGDTASFYSVHFSETDARTSTCMGTADRVITATYRQILPHTVTVHQLSGDVTYTQDEFTSINITAENAPTGKVFTGWTKTGYGDISNSSSQTITYTFGNGDGELTPNYVNTWTITVVGGTIDGSSSAVLREGSSYRLQVPTMYVYEKFDGWTQDGPGTIANPAFASTTFTVGNGDATITAHISQYPDKTLTIYMRDPDTETDTLISSTTYRYRSSVIIEAPVAPNQTTFLSWLGDVEALSPSALASSVAINDLTTDTVLVATYFYPESPDYYTLTVYNGTVNGYGSEQSVAVGSQNIITANTPSQGWEFHNWYGDTQYLVNPDLTLSENSVIMPAKAISLYAKFIVTGETPFYRISVTNGKAKGTYIDDQGNPQTAGGTDGSVYIDVPAGAEVTLIADPDTIEKEFDRWSGNFEQAGVNDIDVSINPTTFTMVESGLNIEMIRKDRAKYTVYPTNANGPGEVYPGTYPISGNLVNTEERHYVFTGWTCVDANNLNCINAIADPTSTGISTTITLTDKDLWATANYTTYYKLTVVSGQDTGSGYYYNGQTVNTVYANNAPTGMQFDHWEDPVGIIDTVNSNIYDPTPIIIMKDSIATLTAVFTSIDANGNSIAITGNDLHNNIITRTNSQLINGVFAVGTIVFDRDGCIGVITQVNPDNNDNTDDYRTQKLFYGGNF